MSTVPPAPPSKPKTWLIVLAALIAVAVIGTVMFLKFGPDAIKTIRETRESVDKLEAEQLRLKIHNDLKSLTQACVAYKVQHGGNWPASLRVLTQRDELGHGPYVLDEAALRDPWDREYLYDATGPKNQGHTPDIFCVIPNREWKIGNWPRGSEKLP